MKENILEKKIKAGDFITTAEYLPRVDTEINILDTLKADGPLAINVSDNPYGPVMSSLSASALLIMEGVEPIFQIVTRDRNRIALQSEILGAASLGIKNILCLSGYHQSFTGMPQSSNVYDIDSIQLINIIDQMNNDGILMDGTKIEGDFSMFVGAVANPYLRPLELNIIRLRKKIEAGAKFIQTQAIFGTTAFQEWLDEANKEGLTEKAAIIAGIFPLSSYKEAIELLDLHTDFYIPSPQLERIKDAGDEEAQKQMGISLCVETINKIKSMTGLSGIHIISGGKEDMIKTILSKASI
jgi:methylenetetrahydrofolate reductase (NADPH)